MVTSASLDRDPGVELDVISITFFAILCWREVAVINA